MDCRSLANQAECTCTYASCDKRGVCCECILYHRRRKEIPGCLFPKESEKTYDRSVKAFVKAHARYL
ncbi:MAG: DUF6485 family protein [Armatimonadota bacterium]